MFETLFGEGQYGLKFVFAFIVVLALIALTAWLVRRFGAERLGTGTARGRQPRLAVIDAASVDGRRRLVLIRRDNVEHLMMIGGPTDVVVEANIVRAAAAPPRDAQVPRPPVATDTLPRAVPLGEGSMWPLQPEPAPAPPPVSAPPPRLEPAQPPRLEPTPPPRPEPVPSPRLEPPTLPRVVQRHTQPPPAPVVSAEEEAEWTGEPEPAPVAPPPQQPAPQRRARISADPLAGLADEIARTQPPQPEPGASGEPRPARRETRIPRAPVGTPPAPPPSLPFAAAPEAPQANEPFNSPADQNLAEMAHRLEAALRRPGKPDGFAEQPSRTAPSFEPESGEPEAYEQQPPQRAPASEARPARSEPRPARADRTSAAAPKSSLYDSLEQEMASLLGRPNNKP
jgi:flagellar protein FliO/FliZ